MPGPSIEAKDALDARWRRLVHEKKDALLARARALTRNAHDAEDAFQDACLELLPRLGDFDDARAAAWLSVATTHRALDRARRSAARAPALLRETSDARPTAPDVDSEIDRALDRLPARAKDVVLRRLVGGESFPEIAATLGIAVGTAKTHYTRAIDALRRSLKKPHDGDER